MTRTEMLSALRTLLCDTQSVGFPDDAELLKYLDHATVVYSEQLIADKDPSMLKRMSVVGCMDLPADFVALAGQHPVQITGRHMDYYGDVPYKITYWGYLPMPASYAATDTVVHPAVAIPIILDMARMYALNRNEYDIAQDQKLVDSWATTAKGARA
jgi:hypothetical protein